MEAKYVDLFVSKYVGYIKDYSFCGILDSLWVVKKKFMFPITNKTEQQVLPNKLPMSVL